jgi:hypothetical protein
MTVSLVAGTLSGILFLSSTTLLAREKTDVVLFKNGDRVTCEIQKLEQGLLRVKTEGMGTVEIEWDDIASISSDHVFELESETGAKLYGPIVSGQESGHSQVLTEAGPVIVHNLSIVSINPIEKRFHQRWRGSVDIGFSFAKANQEVQWSGEGALTYRGKKGLVDARVSSLFSDREDTDSNLRNSFGIQAHRYRGQRWFLALIGRFQQNEELDLDLRSTGGGGVGRYIRHTNKTILSVLGGAVYSREKYLSAAGTNQAEGLLALRLQKFTYDAPRIDFATEIVFLPSISDAGRFRLDVDSKLRYEIFRDFFWSLGFWDNFDSRPPTDGSKNDLGISTGVGWSF